ncbi:YcaO-like family protein [Pseudomonas sp. NPDC090201]|uniref:YcaO-like family protein n=1 Tax=Pseudomonas sp. NPDC090201 TaxID=3364475 RepID=UPI0037FC71A4
MLSGLPAERAFPYSEALLRFDFVRDLFGLKSHVYWAGDGLKTAKCILSNQYDEQMDFGYGKGPRNSALTGAAFESLEHYLSQSQHISDSSVHYFSAGDYLASTHLRINRALETLTTDHKSKLPFRLYNCLSKDIQALYPVALSAPKYLDDIADGYRPLAYDEFDYSSMNRYATNSGVAIGCTAEEAIIHGLLESVERHVFSNFLVSVFLSPHINKVNEVDRSSLPSALVQLLGRAEKAISGKIILLSLANEFEIPVFMASMADSSFSIDPAGFGASLSREYAIRRSITELVQCFHVTTCFHPESVVERDELVLSHLEPFNLHKKCASLKVMSHIRKYGSKKVDFVSLPNYPMPRSLDSYLELGVSKVANAGFDPYTTLLASPYEKVFVSHTFLDGQDNFYCVTEGALVLPNDDVIDRIAIEFDS